MALNRRQIALVQRIHKIRPNAQPVAGKTWEQCFSRHDGRYVLYYDRPLLDGQMTTGLIVEKRKA